jgi:hypothetical protein
VRLSCLHSLPGDWLKKSLRKTSEVLKDFRPRPTYVAWVLIAWSCGPDKAIPRLLPCAMPRQDAHGRLSEVRQTSRSLVLMNRSSRTAQHSFQRRSDP